jgi:hypothetical protein
VAPIGPTPEQVAAAPPPPHYAAPAPYAPPPPQYAQQPPPGYYPPPQVIVQKKSGGCLKAIGVATVVFVALVVIVIIAAVAGSGSKKAATTTGGGGAPATPHAIGQTAHSGDFDITVNSAEDPFTSTNTFETAPAGDHWVAIDLTMHNTANEAKPVSSLLEFELTDPAGRKYDQGFVTTGQQPIDGNIPPNDQREGILTYQVPDGVTGLVLRVKGDITAGGVTFTIP